VSSMTAGNRLVGPVRIGIRAAFLVNLLLGIYIWTGRGDPVIPVHLATGILLVVLLAILVVLAVRQHVSAGLIGAAIVVGLAAPALGLTQENLLVGNLHWILQVVHLLLGFALIGVAENLSRVLLRGRQPS
jgi:hypothetical protein